MTIKKTEQTIVTCDRCKKQWDLYKHDLHLYSDLKGGISQLCMGKDCGGHNFIYDLCDKCTIEFEKFMEKK